MFKKWKAKRADKWASKLKIERNDYLTRLKNSAGGFCGTRYSGEGPFLSINEVNILMWAELERKSNET